MGKSLSKEDIIALSKNLTASTKADTVKKVSAYYNGENLTEQGMKLAEDIFRIMVADVEVKVREVLSDSLKNSKNIPQDIVKKLINDKASVSIPFIKFYESLSKDDLLSIIEAQNVDSQKAVAQRKNLHADVSEAIAKKCDEEVVVVLVSNNSANIKEATYDSIVKKYPESESIKKSLVYRNELPVAIAEKIVSSLSEELQKRLVLNHDLPADLASNIVEQVKEKATLLISEDYSSDKQIEQLVRQLHNYNRLTSSLIVRAICSGDLKFFEFAISFLTKDPISEVRKILFNSSADFMIRNLLRKAFIPSNMFPAVFSALKVINEFRFDCSRSNRSRFSHKVIERILSLENATHELEEDDLKYLISKIT